VRIHPPTVHPPAQRRTLFLVSETGAPADWEADVLLSDGTTAHLRPIHPGDAGRLVEFYARVSPESKYLRFFAPYPVLSDTDVKRFTEVDHVDRVALILTLGSRMVAVGRYDRIDATDAEVAFLVEDTLQGKGAGQLLLEHLAEAARERGIQRFVADVLPQNRRMVQVFADAGYKVHREYEDGMIVVEFPILPTESSWEVMLRREHRAEATSVRRLLHPRSLAMIGPPLALTRGVRALREGGFTGDLVAVCPGHGDLDLGDVPLVADVAALPAGLDIVATVQPPGEVAGLIDQVAGKCFGMYVIHGGDFGGEDNYAIVDRARANGLRLLGPDALGVINTAAEISLNASPAPMPRPGSVGLFCQSSAVGVMLLSGAIQRHLGLATFISSGLFADVTSNDVMQYWMDDDATRVCALSLDRIGNPRKFSRIVRQLAMRKPVVLFSPGRSRREARIGSAEGMREIPEAAVDAIFRQSGVIVCNRRDMMYDVAQILVRQPLPAGERVRVVTNSPALATHIHRVGQRTGLACDDPVILPATAGPDDYAQAARATLADEGVDIVVAAVVDLFNVASQEAHRALLEVARTSTKTLLGVFADFIELAPPADEADGPGRLPTFASYADAMEALGAVTRYARWRELDHGTIPDIGADHKMAREQIREVLTGTPEGRRLTPEELQRLLAAYGIDLVPRYEVDSLEEAYEVAAELGWDVVLKAGAEHVRHSADSGSSVFRQLDSREELAEAWHDLGNLVTELGLGAGAEELQLVARPVVQKMVSPGMSMTIRSMEDPAFGPVVSLGVSGLASTVLGDTAYRGIPMTTSDAAQMVRDLQAAPVLFGGGDHPPLATDRLQDLLHRVAQLADAHPQLAEVTLDRVIVSPSGVRVVAAAAQILPTAAERDALSRSL
jgi:acyl-CoA synthetase (NDP forming)/GNAT superfamily N-acetyltransferase